MIAFTIGMNGKERWLLKVFITQLSQDRRRDNAMYRRPYTSLGVAIVTGVAVLATACAAGAEDFQTKWQQLIKAAQAEGQILLYETSGL